MTIGRLSQAAVEAVLQAAPKVRLYINRQGSFSCRGRRGPGLASRPSRCCGA